MKLQVAYSPEDREAKAIADGWAKNEARHIAASYALTKPGNTFLVPAAYSTFSVLNELRLLRAKGEIKGEFEIIYGGLNIAVDDDGYLEHWPRGMDFHMDFLEALFDAQEEKRNG